MLHNDLTRALARLTFAIFTVLIVLSLTACGGNGTTGTPPEGTTITASFTGVTMPSAIAYQIGTSGSFQTLALTDAIASFTVPSGTDAYGFAYVCPTFLDGVYYSNQSIIQATTADTTSLSFACPAQSANLSATYDASAIPGVQYVTLCVLDYSDTASGPAGSLGITGIPTGTYDVAVEALGNNGVLAIQIQRGVSVTTSTLANVAFPPMTAADQLGTASISLTNVPSSAMYSGFEVTYNTTGGLSMILGSSGLTQTTYPTAPASQTQSGDFYLINAGADLTTQSITTELSSNTATSLTVPLPTPLSSVPAPTPAAFPTFTANTTGFTVPGTVVNSTWIQYQTPAMNSTVYNLYTYVTQSWLGSDTIFVTPNLSTLAGFQPAPPSGGTEFWSLYSTAGSPLQLDTIPIEQTQIQNFTSPTSVQYMQYAGAFATP